MGPREPAHVSCTPLLSVNDRPVGAVAAEPGTSSPDRRGSARTPARRRRGAAASTPSVAGTISTSARGAAERPSVEAVLDGRGDERVEAGEAAAEHDARRVEHVDEAGEPDAEPLADLVERGERRRHRRRRRRRGPPRPRRCRRRRAGRPGRAAPPRRPRSPSSRPSRTGRSRRPAG